MKDRGNITFAVTLYVEKSSELCQISKTKIFDKIVNGFKPSTICARTPS